MSSQQYDNVYMELMVNTMRNPEHIDKTEIVIQSFLALLGKRVSRTQIVKLVYLADNLFYESTGRSITGTQYMWGHCGPNAVDNAIADTADQLASAGDIRRTVGSYNGSPTFNYWVNDTSATWKNATSALNDGERQIVLDIARKYGRYNASDLAALSKKTKPFENARKYDLLRFKQSERAIELQNKLASQPDFLREVELGLADLEAGRWVWADEVDV